MEFVVDNIFSNDDCLLTIFQNLKLKELTRVTRVLKQFQRIAHRTFRIKYKKMNFNEYFDCLNKKWIFRILINFGYLMEDIIITMNFRDYFSPSVQRKILKSIVDRCIRNDYPLRTLKLTRFLDMDICSRDIHNAFKNLHTLHLHRIEISLSVGTLLNELENAREIKIIDCKPPGQITENPTIDQNLHMERLHLKGTQDLHIMEVLHTIDETFPNIIDLTFDVPERNKTFRGNIHRIGKLGKLQYLDINLHYYSLATIADELTKNNRQIRRLRLKNVSIKGKEIEILDGLKTLRELYFFEAFAPLPTPQDLRRFVFFNTESDVTKYRMRRRTKEHHGIERTN